MALIRSASTLPSGGSLTDSVRLFGSRSYEDALGCRLASTAGGAGLVIDSSTIRLVYYKSSISISARLIKLDSLPCILRSLRSHIFHFSSRLLLLSLVLLITLRNRALGLVLTKTEGQVQLK